VPTPLTLPHHAFRFGVQAPSAPDAASWRNLARRAEDLGYAVLSVADHLRDQFATTPALMAAADATTTLRLGSIVYCNDLHHPAVLAKEAATLDLLSDGRLELGMGAGWMVEDYDQAGITLDRPGVRIERLGEAVRIVKALMGPDPVHVTGEHYRIDGLIGSPRPVQSPRPPIFLGGGGRRMLTLAGAEADIVGLNIDMRSGRIDEHSGPNATDRATEDKLAWIAAAAGDRFLEIELQVRVEIATVTDDPMGLAAALGPAFGITAEEALASPHALAGSLGQLTETCVERRERFGISYLTVPVEAMDEMAPLVAALAGR
jgi:probable F420-dependent oxidoreductase